VTHQTPLITTRERTAAVVPGDERAKILALSLAQGVGRDGRDGRDLGHGPVGDDQLRHLQAQCLLMHLY
jgi:hypothetical protein